MTRPAWLVAVLMSGSGLFAPASVRAQFTLYVSNRSGTTVSTVNASGTVTNHSFATGLTGPAGLAFDTGGNLYISNAGSTTVSEVGPAGGAAATFASGFSDPRGLAFYGGNLYVANYNSGAGTTVAQVNAAGAITNSSFASGLTGPLGLAFDTSGNLYISNFAGGSGSTVSKVASGGGAATTFATGFFAPSGLAFYNGDLYVANFATNTVSEVNALGTIIVANYATGLNHPVGLAFDSNGDLFVANDGMNAGTTISEVAPGGGAATTFASGLSVPTFLAFQPVPEPSSLALAMSALGVIAGYHRLRRRRAAA